SDICFIYTLSPRVFYFFSKAFSTALLTESLKPFTEDDLLSIFLVFSMRKKNCFSTT
ncbi:unnamed protein product, partial [Urochloa humidicola]